MEEKKLVFISDTHTKHSMIEVPEGDFIIHCGDVSYRGSENEIIDFADWFSSLPHKHKIMIPGNHDFLFERYYDKAKNIIESRDIICLIDCGIELEGIKFWGSPITPWFHSWAFNRYRGSDIEQHWNKIPDVVDVLLTHGPPAYMENYLSMILEGEDVGCEDLYNTIKKRVNPKISAFGHIHEGYGLHDDGQTIFINCSALNRRYEPANRPVEIRFSEGKFSTY
jgi:Icc-related predicted phosphoesterase